MINIGMTIREMVALASNSSCNGDLYERIISALEKATGTAMMVVACNGVQYDGQFWDHKIAAIKSLRLATGMGLKDAKDWVEEAQYHSKTIYTKPLNPEVAHKLCDELSKCGCSCWTTNA